MINSKPKSAIKTIFHKPMNNLKIHDLRPEIEFVIKSHTWHKSISSLTSVRGDRTFIII
jgi:hypothetical protein